MLLADVRYVVVQAGGLGTRLGPNTRNKPKCLVSVDGQPLIYHLFARFPHATFLVIVDHLAEVFERYLAVFPPRVAVRVLRASGTGTAAGMRAAAAALPDREPVLLVWGDLKLGRLPAVEIGQEPLVGLTAAFPCRWSWPAGGRLVEAPCTREGVMGLFVLPDRTHLAACPEEGEFVRWLAESGRPLAPVRIEEAVEIGTLPALAAHRARSPQARYFNAVTLGADTVEKRARDPDFAPLITAETAWYRAVSALGYPHVPALVRDEPLTLARVRGVHPDAAELDRRGRQRHLAAILEALARLHGLATRPGAPAACRRMYHDKPLARLAGLRALVPDLVARETLTINGRTCRNVLHPGNADWFASCLGGLVPDRFVPIHGDPTFSNILIDAAEKPWLIDPRGRFDGPSLFGDPRYDWAKLYYSVVGHYDAFNRRAFALHLAPGAVTVEMPPNAWADVADDLAAFLGADLPAVRRIHASIWLSLSGFVADDYDSIIAAYALGLYHLAEAVA